MSRWRVKASRRTATWFHAVEVRFLDAESAADAKSHVERDPELEVWAVTPATPKMETDYQAWQAKCEEWIRRVQAGENPRGLL